MERFRSGSEIKLDDGDRLLHTQLDQTSIDSQDGKYISSPWKFNNVGRQREWGEKFGYWHFCHQCLAVRRTLFSHFFTVVLEKGLSVQFHQP